MLAAQPLDRSGPSLADGRAVRLAARSGAFAEHTSGVAPGYVQGNLVVLPREVLSSRLVARVCVQVVQQHGGGRGVAALHRGVQQRRALVVRVLQHG